MNYQYFESLWDHYQSHQRRVAQFGATLERARNPPTSQWISKEHGTGYGYREWRTPEHLREFRKTPPTLREPFLSREASQAHFCENDQNEIHGGQTHMAVVAPTLPHLIMCVTLSVANTRRAHSRTGCKYFLRASREQRGQRSLLEAACSSMSDADIHSAQRPLILLVMCGIIWGLCILAAIFGLWRICCMGSTTSAASTTRSEKATQCSAVVEDEDANIHYSAVVEGSDIHYVEMKDRATGR